MIISNVYNFFKGTLRIKLFFINALQITDYGLIIIGGGDLMTDITNNEINKIFQEFNCYIKNQFSLAELPLGFKIKEDRSLMITLNISKPSITLLEVQEILKMFSELISVNSPKISSPLNKPISLDKINVKAISYIAVPLDEAHFIPILQIIDQQRKEYVFNIDYSGDTDLNNILDYIANVVLHMLAKFTENKSLEEKSFMIADDCEAVYVAKEDFSGMLEFLFYERSSELLKLIIEYSRFIKSEEDSSV